MSLYKFPPSWAVSSASRGKGIQLDVQCRVYCFQEELLGEFDRSISLLWTQRLVLPSYISAKVLTLGLDLLPSLDLEQ